MDPRFSNIIDESAVDALIQYAPLYDGINKNQLASIEQGKAFVQDYVQALAKQKTGANINDPAQVGIPASAVSQANYVPVEELLTANFPTDKRINLHMIFEGPKVEEEDQIEGDDSTINVAMAIKMYFGTPTTAPNPDGLWDQITKKPVPSAPAPAAPAPPPPPNFDPPPVHGHNEDGTAKKPKK